jgi:hypothetical protein
MLVQLRELFACVSVMQHSRTESIPWCHGPRAPQTAPVISPPVLDEALPDEAKPRSESAV